MSNLVPVTEIQTMATAVAKSGLFGVKTPDQAFALMLIAQAEGLHPAIAARDYHVIQGRPALKADAMLARFQTAGGRVDWKCYTDDEVTGVFSHPSGGSVTVCWTLAQAKSIGLAGKDNWKSYPRAMLRARCISEGIRTVYPGCVVGVYTPEEVQDFDVPPQKEKHMGAAEVVVPERKTSGIAFYVPGSPDPYAFFDTMHEWAEEFVSMAERIKKSAKLSNEDKASKLSALVDANKKTIEADSIIAEACYAAMKTEDEHEL